MSYEICVSIYIEAMWRKITTLYAVIIKVKIRSLDFTGI